MNGTLRLEGHEPLDVMLGKRLDRARERAGHLALRDLDAVDPTRAEETREELQATDVTGDGVDAVEGGSHIALVQHDDGIRPSRDEAPDGWGRLRDHLACVSRHGSNSSASM